MNTGDGGLVTIGGPGARSLHGRCVTVHCSLRPRCDCTLLLVCDHPGDAISQRPAHQGPGRTWQQARQSAMLTPQLSKHGSW